MHDLSHYLHQMKNTAAKTVHSFNFNKDNTADARDNDDHDTAVVAEFINKNDAEATEVQNFFGYAINELIYETRTHAKQEKLENWYNDNNTLTEMDHCYWLAKSLRVLHEDAAKDDEYLQQFYPIFVASSNKGGLCLVAKHIFPFGKQLLCHICSYLSPKRLSSGDRNTCQRCI